MLRLTADGSDGTLRDAIVVNDADAKAALEADETVATAIASGRMTVVTLDQARTLNGLLSTLETVSVAGRPFLDARQAETARFKFFIPEGLDMSGFADGSDLDPVRFRFFLLITAALNPVALEVRQGDLKEIDRVLRLINSQA
jgi:hypothetical protein